jgi:3-methyladenine DNA glycosylase AlkD
MECNSLIKSELYKLSDEEKAKTLQKFFQTFPGGYAEGDIFIGVSVPNQRKVAKRYYQKISMKELSDLINAEIHEYRLTALFILVQKFVKTKQEQEQQKLIDFYLHNLDRVDNWDLVDSSAYKLLGAFLYDKERSILYQLAESENLWHQRIAMIATFYFIKQNDYSDSLKIAKLLLNHPHDLIHKAVGWMLREIGNRDFKVELQFLRKHYKTMPRTMLRYAIEKFDNDLRKKFLQGYI